MQTRTIAITAAALAGLAVAIQAGQVGYALATNAAPEPTKTQDQAELAEAVADRVRGRIAEPLRNRVKAGVEDAMMSSKEIQAAVQRGMVEFLKDRTGAGSGRTAADAGDNRDAGGRKAVSTTQSVPAVTAADHVQGPADARYTLIEYSDYECPYCARLHNRVMPELRKRMGDDLRIVYRHRPLAMHNPEAKRAALAAECVADLGGEKAFWRFTDRLFGQDSGGLAAVARQVGIDGDKFSPCLDDKRHADRVQRDLKQARRLGVRGTPTMYVRRTGASEARRIRGAQPPSRIISIINDLDS